MKSVDNGIDDLPCTKYPILFHQFILQYALEKPNKVAIVWKEQEWTYNDLQTFSQKYAEMFQSLNFITGDRVILELDPSPQAVALIIACSIAGLVFVPVSPEIPFERLEKIIEITEPVALVSEKKVFHENKSLNYAQIQVLNDVIQISNAKPIVEKKPSTKLIDTDIAYIIFTSGTTGTPKGIMMSHRAVLSFYRGMLKHCQMSPDSRVGSFSSLQFDFSLLDIGLALGSGQTLVLVPRVLFLKPRKFVDYLINKQITQMNATPSVWKTITRDSNAGLERLTNLRCVFYGGDFFPIQDIAKLKSLIPKLEKITNAFGQSESIGCTFIDVQDLLGPDHTEVPIGRAHSEVDIILVDDNEQLITEANVYGEMYLRGTSLFSGYWKNTEQTDRVLVPNPIRPHTNELVFKTGDIACIREDGNFYYKGRRDHQIKMNGNRVEIEEIELKLMTHPNINVAVIAKSENNKEILAFILPNTGEDEHISEIELRKFCSVSLTKYMIPDRFIIVNEIPVTINSKIDRHKLKKYSLVGEEREL
ncbi:amino acid adenylation domain-containing protein [Paenibacillus pabuli]|uniref:Amino acid adenylation domain-containing protein n=1 Tax=Paenibacillus pabuli TaxID=1472 RepID=A0ABX9BEP9_9BACL|nr:AMP-binding protein [Paenibacillus pabuli]RAI89546.1 amino acid adenylation domain-containing protein [Paenibacillus pabuli]